MHVFSPVLLITFASMVVASFTWIFASKATKHMGPLKSLFLFQLMGVPLFVFLLPIAPHVVNINYLAIALIGIAETFILLLLFYALHVGEASIVIPITDTYGFIAAIIGIIFLHESVFLFKMIGMIAILLGVILIGLKLSDLVKKKNIGVHSGVVPAALMAIGTAIYLYFVTLSSRESGWLATAMGIRISISITAFVVLLLRGEKIGNMLRGVTWRFLIPCVVCDVISFSLYSMAVGVGELSYVTIIYSAQSVLSVVWAYLFLKEKLNALQLVGLFSVVAGLIFLQLH